MCAMRLVFHYHCTAAFNPSAEYKQLPDCFVNTREWLVLFESDESCPHVAVTSGYELKHIGEMMAQY